MNKKKLNNNKGFTLVELIVVLVILAILAAILVPALLGYIDRAKGQQIVLNARSAYTAAQAEMTSMYAKSTEPTDALLNYSTGTNGKRLWSTADVSDCTALKIGCKAAYATTVTHDMYTVVYVEYTEKGETVYLVNGEWLSLTSDGAQSAPTGVKVYTVK